MSSRLNVTFTSGGETCAAWLYLPEHVAAGNRSPVIVMGHGLGGTRELRLDAYAERFRAAGYACLVFDYRHFGDSGGEPRQLLDIGLQLEDWRAAIAFARSRDELYPERIVLWGTSFAGGHVIEVAAGDGRIAATISQCPFTDGLASALATSSLRTPVVVVRALRDAVGAKFGRPPVMVPIVGAPGTTALMATPDALPGYLAMAPDGIEIRNEVAARVALRIMTYRPGRRARMLHRPALFCVCTGDSVAPAGATLRHARHAPRGECEQYGIGHFDIYHGDDFEQAITDQLAFLNRHVPA